MDVLGLLSSVFACSRLLGLLGGVYCPKCVSRGIKGYGYGYCLKRYFCGSCRGTFNDEAGTIFHYSRLSLGEWFMLLLLRLHNSSLRLSWLLDRSPMTVRALRRLMLKLKVEFRGVDVDELYVNGLKGGNNSIRVKHLGRGPRHRAFRRRGRGSWIYDKPAVFILVGGGEVRTMLHQATLRLSSSAGNEGDGLMLISLKSKKW